MKIITVYNSDWILKGAKGWAHLRMPVSVPAHQHEAAELYVLQQDNSRLAGPDGGTVMRLKIGEDPSYNSILFVDEMDRYFHSFPRTPRQFHRASDTHYSGKGPGGLKPKLIDKTPPHGNFIALAQILNPLAHSLIRYTTTRGKEIYIT